MKHRKLVLASRKQVVGMTKVGRTWTFRCTPFWFYTINEESLQKYKYVLCNVLKLHMSERTFCFNWEELGTGQLCNDLAEGPNSWSSMSVSNPVLGPKIQWEAEVNMKETLPNKMGIFMIEHPSLSAQGQIGPDKLLTIPAIIISWSASSCFLFSSFSASCSCFNISFTSLSRSVTSANVLSASALVLVAF